MATKVLFIANHRLDRSPGQRFRFEQYLGFLEENGYECTLSYIISEKDDRILYNKGFYLQKAIIAIKSWWKRLNDLKRANEFDIIFIYREALLTASTKFEKAFSKSSAKVIFDFDDAIWLPNVSSSNKSLQKLKKPSKVNSIISYADLVFAGNNYLAEYARKYNSEVVVIPTTIDTNYHVPKSKENQDKVVIGWTGTQTTLKYLEILEPVFKELKDIYKEKVAFQIICDHQWESNLVDVEFVEWQKENEIAQLQEFDIGVMPLIDDAWSRGKCGFKGLQYMALGIPAILSPVGVNKEIINDGENGFLANTNDEWKSILEKLIKDKELRVSIGNKARKTILDKYSVEAIKNSYLNYFNQLLK